MLAIVLLQTINSTMRGYHRNESSMLEFFNSSNMKNDYMLFLFRYRSHKQAYGYIILPRTNRANGPRLDFAVVADFLPKVRKLYSNYIPYKYKEQNNRTAYSSATCSRSR